LVASLLDGLSGTHLLFGSLAVQSSPAGATVAVNGKTVGTAPLSLRGLPVGAVEITAELEGHEAAKATLMIVDGNTTNASLSLPRSTGTLALVVPKDAVVEVKSAEIGQKELTGAGGTELPTGDYEVQASCPGLPAVSTRVTITRGFSAQLLPWTKGYLDVQAVPAGALIVVDGVERGVAPLVVEGEPGTPHRVELRKDKYEAYRVELSADAGNKVIFSEQLTGLPGSIRVETSIVGADVYLDPDTDQGGSNRKAVTPAVFDDVRPGAHVVQIGYATVGKRLYTVGDPIQVEVKPGEPTVVSRTFVEGKAHLTVTDAPAGSVLEIDGRKMESGQELTAGVEVPAGTLDVAIDGPNSQKWTGSISPDVGGDVKQSIYSMK